MHLKNDREIRYNAGADILRELQRKAVSGQLGATKSEQLATAQRMLERGATIDGRLDKFVTGDPGMIQLKARLRLLYKRAEPVLITGPTGTGKELLAKALQIPGEPFIAENCGAIPESLVESVFFGHVKGAFTGALCDKTGLLEEAGEGIIFLDEIGDMPLTIQAKFLRAIQENEIRRVGSLETIEIGCRFVAATKYDLESRVEKGLFREDLYARLFTYQLRVTGLKDRWDDVRLITQSMLPMPEDIDKLPPFPEAINKAIEKYNVRAIEAALARHRAYEDYL